MRSDRTGFVLIRSRRKTRLGEGSVSRQGISGRDASSTFVFGSVPMDRFGHHASAPIFCEKENGRGRIESAGGGQGYRGADKQLSSQVAVEGKGRY